MDDEALAKLLAIYRAELEEDLAPLVSVLEKLRGAAPDAADGYTNEAMRIAHRIKGNSSAVGFKDSEALAHALEEALLGVRTCSDPERALTLMLRATDRIYELGRGPPRPASAEAARLACEIRAFGPAVSNDVREGDGAEPASAAVGGPEAMSDRLRAFDPAPENDLSAEANHAPQPGTFRVDGERLEELLLQSAEVLGKSAHFAKRGQQLEALLEQFEELCSGFEGRQYDALLGPVNSLQVLVQETRRDLRLLARAGKTLHQSVRSLRMLALEVEEPFWRRVVRNAASTLGKEVEVRVSVARVQLDKRVLEALREPFLHLLRNAVAHGIEAPGERLRIGKVRSGRITITGRAVGDVVAISIADDGRGLDTDMLARAAVEKGVRRPDEVAAMTRAERLQLVFEPGLSTAREVDPISGRGVGLDAVRRSVEALGGYIEMGPGAKAGAVAQLTVPASVLSMQGLRVRCGQMTHLLPMESVQRTLRVQRSELGRVDGCWTLRQRNRRPIRIEPMNRLLGVDDELNEGWNRVVVVQRSQSVFGLVVDEIVETGEYLLKPLPWNAHGLPGVAGGVLLADGTIGAVVDLQYLLTRLNDSKRTSNEPARDQRPHARRVLVVDDSATTRTLSQSALADAGYEVVTAQDGQQAWELLHEHHFDALISDIQMPRLDGLELTRRVRGHAVLWTLPVILVTSLGTTEEIRQGGEAGADEYVLKNGDYARTELTAALARQVLGKS